MSCDPSELAELSKCFQCLGPKDIEVVKTYLLCQILEGGSLPPGVLPVASGGTGTNTQFTQGSVVFAGAAGVYSQDNANFFWDESSKRMGLGTNTPSRMLHLSGVVNDVAFALTKTDIVMPDYTALGFIEPMFGFAGTSSSALGGVQVSGFSASGSNSGIPAMITGYHGGASPTTAAIRIRGAKHNGATSAEALSATERILEVFNWSTGNILVITGDGSTGLGAAPNASAKLQVDSTTKGVLFPRMTTTQKDAIASPEPGLVVYDTTLGKLCVRGASAWETITSS